MNRHGERMTIILGYKNMSLYFSRKGNQNFRRVWERDRDRETEIHGGFERHRLLDTAILTHNFFSWPCHTMLYSGHYIFASSASQPGPTVGRCPTSLYNWSNLFWLQDWNWPLLCEYLCIHNFIMPTHFQFNPCAAYTYALLPSCLHWCVLQPLCLHSWNIQLCQRSIYNSSFL